MVECGIHMQEGTRNDSIPEAGSIQRADSIREAGVARRTDTTGSTHGTQRADSIRSTHGTQPADSLAAVSASDSLPEPQHADSTAWNSLGYILPLREAGAAEGQVVWRDTTARAVFGVSSTRVAPGGELQPTRSIPTDNIPFQGLVLMLAVIYAVLLYRNLGDIRTLLSRTFHDAPARKRLSEETGSSGFSHFLNVTVTLGLLFAGLLAVKFGGGRLDGLLPDNLAQIAMPGLALATTLVGALVLLYQYLMLQGAGAITVSRPFILQLLQLRRNYLALIVVCAAPVLLLYVLCPPDSGRIWLYALLAESAVAAILYLKESLGLFLSKNFSILLWFLYLCTVELFPISLLWLLLTRGEASIQ